MYDFSSLTNNLEGSGVGNVIIIALMSFVLSSLIALVYEKTSQEMQRPRYFIQSLILISIPVATVMQAIGDSLARGLGMLGALAIIRFRTTLSNPRNMVFMFTSISVGIAAGVYGIAISIVGTIGFCIVVLILHFSSLKKNNYVIGVLQFEIANKELATPNMSSLIENTLTSYCKKVELAKYGIIKKKKNNAKGVTVFEYKFKIENSQKAAQLANELAQIGLLNVKIIFKDDYEKI
jgi:uncharacterized membrane protein YhiD involved in acid resistance